MPFYTDSIGGGIGTEPQGYSRSDDGSSDRLPLGFSLTYFGQTYDQFFVNINGNISFGDNRVRTLKSAFFFLFCLASDCTYFFGFCAVCVSEACRRHRFPI